MSAKPVFANPPSNPQGVKECERWMLGMASVLSADERRALESESKGEKEVDTAHDIKKNDPTDPATELVTKEYFKQNAVMVVGVNPHINHNIRGSFAQILGREPKDTERVLRNSRSRMLLGMHSDRYIPKVENGPSTVNSDSEYCGISDRSHGYCWGYATMVRFFHSLAFYDPFLPKLKKTASYLALIDRILAGEATIIPGYANLRELSLVPEYELYLKLNTMELWKTRAARFTSFSIFKNATKPMSVFDRFGLILDLKKRIARNEMPKIIFSSLIPSSTILGMNTDIHVVLANQVEDMPNGNIRIHIWDINFYAETLMKSPKFLEIDTDGAIHYAPWYEPTRQYAEKSDLVANIQIAPENDAETIAMIHSLSRFCKRNPLYCFNK